MRKFKLLSLVLTFMIVVSSVSSVVFAASYAADDMGTPTFVYGGLKPTNVNMVNSSEPDYTANTTWTDDSSMFKSGWKHTQINAEQNSYDNNYIQFVFDTSKVFGSNYSISEGDLIYLSMYVKSDPTFDFKGETYTAVNNPDYINIKLGGNNNKGSQMYNLSAYDTNQKRLFPKTYIPADGNWMKLSYAIYVESSMVSKTDITSSGTLKITVDFSAVRENFSVSFANDFTVGKMNFDSSKTYTDQVNSRAYDYITYVIDNLGADAKYISTDGFITPIVTEEGEKVTSYDVTVSSDEPEIMFSNSEIGSFTGCSMPSYYTKTNDSLSVTAYAPAYDKTKADNYLASYISARTYDSWIGSANGLDSLRQSVHPNSFYKETYTLNTDINYKVFAPSSVNHNFGVGNSAYKNTYASYSGDTVSETVLENDTFNKGYVMKLLKSEEGLSAISDDVHYYQFSYDIDGFADRYDFVMYSMYVKIETEGQINPSFKFYGDPSGATVAQTKATGNQIWYVLIDTVPSTGEAFSDEQWHKVIIAVDAVDSETNPYIRLGVKLDGSVDAKITFAEPRCEIVKLPSLTMPNVEKTNNNVRRTFGITNALKADIIGVKANGTFIPVNSDGTVNVPDTIDPIDITPVSTYGDIPGKVSYNDEEGSYEITAYPITYNPLVSGNSIIGVMNRTVTQYTYSDNSTTTAFDYEKSLVTPVTSVATNYNSRNISNTTLSPITIIRRDIYSVTVDFKKDGARPGSSSDLIPADGGSTYEISVSSTAFIDSYSLVCAGVKSNGTLGAVKLQKFNSGKATATFSDITADDDIVDFYAYVWDMTDNKITPITKSFALGSEELGYNFPKVLER